MYSSQRRGCVCESVSRKTNSTASDVHRAAGDGDVYVPSACYAVVLSGQERRAAFVVGPICDGVGCATHEMAA